MRTEVAVKHFVCSSIRRVCLTPVCALAGDSRRWNRHMPPKAGAGSSALVLMRTFTVFQWPLYIHSSSVRSGPTLPRSFTSVSYERQAYGILSSLSIAHRGPSYPFCGKQAYGSFGIFPGNSFALLKNYLKRFTTVQYVRQQNAKVGHKGIVEKTRAS